MEKIVLNEDIIFPQKDKDVDIVDKIPTEISEIGDFVRAKEEEKSKELLQQIADENELLNKLSNY